MITIVQLPVIYRYYPGSSEQYSPPSFFWSTSANKLFFNRNKKREGLRAFCVSVTSGDEFDFPPLASSALRDYQIKDKVQDNKAKYCLFSP